MAGGQNETYRITFSQPIVNPIMPIVSLGASGTRISYNFDSPFTILSQGAGHFGGGPNQLTTTTDLTSAHPYVLNGEEGSGTIQFLGTFSTISWLVPKPEVWHGFTFGILSSQALATNTVNKGQTATNAGNFSDTGGGNVTLSASVGTITQTSGSSGTWAWSDATTDESQSQTVTITARDANGTGTTTFPLTVIDPPVVATAAAGPVAATEGTLSAAQTLATFTDPGGAETPADYSAEVDWGGGTFVSGDPNVSISGPVNGVFTVTGAHTYPDELTGTVRVRIDHENSTPPPTVQLPVIVADAPLTGTTTATAAGGVEGVTAATLSGATFTDAAGGSGSAADFTVTAANWGDGSTDASGLTITGSNGSYTVNGSHLYGSPGTRSFSLTVKDVGGQTAALTGSAAVADAPVTATATPVTTAAYASPFSGEVATFVDANPHATLASFPPADVSIQWGDGTTSGPTGVTQPGGAGTPFHVFASHTYGAAGPTALPLAVTVTDTGGAVSNTTGYTPTIAKAPSTTSVSATGGVYTGSPVGETSVLATGAGGLSDASPADFTFAYAGTGATTYSSSTAPTDTGTYTVTATYNGDANHSTSTSTSTSPATAFSITAATPTVSVTGYAGGTYDGAAHTRIVTVTGVGGDGVVYSTSLSGTDAGAYSLPWSFGNGNYISADESGTLSFGIAQAALKVTADDNAKTYGQAASDTGSVAGVQGSDGIIAAFSSDGDAATAPVGTGAYPITATLSDPNNRLANYNVVETDATLAVNKAALSVTASGNSKTYGDTAADTGTLDGLLNGEPVTASFASDGDAALAHVNTGSYAIKGTLSDPDCKLANYDVTYKDATLTVNKADAGITVNGYSVTYDGLPHSLTGSVAGVAGETADLSGLLHLTYSADGGQHFFTGTRLTPVPTRPITASTATPTTAPSRSPTATRR